MKKRGGGASARCAHPPLKKNHDAFAVCGGNGAGVLLLECVVSAVLVLWFRRGLEGPSRGSLPRRHSTRDRAKAHRARPRAPAEPSLGPSEIANLKPHGAKPRAPPPNFHSLPRVVPSRGARPLRFTSLSCLARSPSISPFCHRPSLFLVPSASWRRSRRPSSTTRRAAKASAASAAAPAPAAARARLARRAAACARSRRRTFSSSAPSCCFSSSCLFFFAVVGARTS